MHDRGGDYVLFTVVRKEMLHGIYKWETSNMIFCSHLSLPIFIDDGHLSVNCVERKDIKETPNYQSE